jgi:hypothetical protein
VQSFRAHRLALKWILLYFRSLNKHQRELLEDFVAETEGRPTSRRVKAQPETPDVITPAPPAPEADIKDSVSASAPDQEIKQDDIESKATEAG